jgi:hypothetical protein
MLTNATGVLLKKCMDNSSTMSGADQLCLLDHEQRSSLISFFVKNARKPNGTKNEPSAFIYTKQIQRYLKVYEKCDVEKRTYDGDWRLAKSAAYDGWTDPWTDPVVGGVNLGVPNRLGWTNGSLRHGTSTLVLR